jgi:formate dehydrogenase major subunit
VLGFAKDPLPAGSAGALGGAAMDELTVSRRQLFRYTGATLAGSSLTALGFSPRPALAEVRAFKLARTTETRNTCPYCSVSCGIIMYGLGDKAKNAKSSIIHIEGDPDHPINRGTLCPKGAALLDFVKAPTRLLYPEYRAPGSAEWKRISWDWAMARIAKLAKEDRDKNFIARNQDGVTVNRWVSTGFLAASATTNETAFLTYKIARSLGIVAFDNQARV